MLIEIICIIDCSGSMHAVKEDTIGGFNQFIEAQKKLEGDVQVTLVQFNHVVKTVYSGTPINDLLPLNEATYEPWGLTAMLDAIGSTIDAVGKRLFDTQENERPQKVIVAILTDGLENASRDYNLDQVKNMIAHQKEVYSWEIIFLGANQDIFAEGAKLGIAKKDTYGFVRDSAGVTAAFRGMTCAVTNYRND